MGLFSSLKKAVSKAWKGIKKAVKTVAKGVKKVAKGVVTSMPGGQKLWKAGGKLGKKVMAAVGKLGPVGIMAVQVLLSATGVGAAIAGAVSSAWGSFGAIAAQAAASGSAIASTLGTIGSGLYAAGNWAVGTLGAVGSAFTEGAGQVMQGNFSAGLKAFSSNLGSALTGEAGMAAVNAGAAQAALASGTQLGGGITSETITTAANQGVTVDGSFAGELGNAPFDAEAAVKAGMNPAEASKMAAAQAERFAITSAPIDNPLLTPEQIAQEAITGKSSALSFAEQGTFIDHGAAGVRAVQPGAANVASGITDTAKSAYETYKKIDGALTPNTADYQGSSSLLAPARKASAIKAATSGGGTGSEGFSLLKGIDGLEQSLRNSQSLMFT
jgi:hypothetical protein